MALDRALEAFRRGDDAEAERLAEADLARAVAAGDAPARVAAVCMLARVALRRDDLAAVRSLARAAREVAVGAGGRELERMPLHLEAVAERMSGRLDAARALYRESITLNDELGEARMAALEHRNLAYVELRDGHPERALSLIAESRRRLDGLDVAALAPYLAFDEATVAAVEGDRATAAARLADADQQFRAAGVLPDPDDAAEMARLRAALEP